MLAEVQALASPIRFLVLGHDPRLRQSALMAGACAFALVGEPPELLLAVLRRVRVALR